MHEPQIDHISRPLVRAFAHMLQHPSTDMTVAELVAVSDGSKAGLYRTMGGLCAARVVKKGRRGRLATFQLRPGWETVSLAQRIRQKAEAQGLLGP